MKKPLLLIFALTMIIAGQAQSTDASLLGSEISKQDAALWMENYTKTHSQEQRICFGKETLNKFLSAKGLESVYIYKGLDEFDKEVLIMKGADKQGELIADAISIYSNQKEMRRDRSSTGCVLNEEAADKMIGKFQTTFTNRINVFLFGRKGFDVILQQSGAKGIHFVSGLDEQQQEHLIFIGADLNGALMADGIAWNHGSGIFSVIKKFFAKN